MWTVKSGTLKSRTVFALFYNNIVITGTLHKSYGEAWAEMPYFRAQHG
jgi:hypothetical protein